MVRAALRQKIEETLEAGSFGGPGYFIDVFDDGDEYVRILIISRKFDIENYNLEERDTLVWANLSKTLTQEELGRISRIVVINPEEIKWYAL